MEPQPVLPFHAAPRQNTIIRLDRRLPYKLNNFPLHTAQYVIYTTIMATIYDTDEDVERARLSNAVNKDRMVSTTSFASGLGAALAGSLLLKDDTLHGASGPAHLKAVQTVIGWMTLTVSALAMAASFLHHRKAKTAEAQLIALPPEVIVLPDDRFTNGVALVPDLRSTSRLPEVRKHSEYCTRLQSESTEGTQRGR
jgi:hypothetical protein